MGARRPPGFPDKSARGPAIWRVSHDQHEQDGKLVSTASICHVLQVEGTRDRALGYVADAQHGVVHRTQLQAAGLGRGAIEHRLAKGSLYQIHPGVYAVGHRVLQPLARELAALLYIGSGSLVSHGSAAGLWGLTQRFTDEVDVTVAGRHAASRPGVRIYRVGSLDPRDVRLRWSIPVTAPARTMIDFAAHAPEPEFRRALSEAHVQGLLTDRTLADAMERVPGRTGIARLKATLNDESGRAPTRSEAERLLLRLIEDAQLPLPAVNVLLEGCEVDFLWRMEKLVVEVDGHGFHGHRAAFEHDRRRDQRLVAAGYRVIRVTWRQLVGEPLAVITRIAQALVAPA
jgi:very-short-patch-repair endonuclease/predicted transcriptional regulator of viral defense system